MKLITHPNSIRTWAVFAATTALMFSGLVAFPAESRGAAAAQVVVISGQDGEANVQVEDVEALTRRFNRTGKAISMSKSFQVIRLPQLSLPLGAEIDLGTMLVVTAEQPDAQGDPQRQVTARWLRPEPAALRRWYQELAFGEGDAQWSEDEWNEDETTIVDRRDNQDTSKRVTQVEVDTRHWSPGNELDPQMSFSVFPSGQLLFSSDRDAVVREDHQGAFRFRHDSSSHQHGHTVVVRPQVIRRGAITLRDHQIGIERVFVEQLDRSMPYLNPDGEAGDRVLYQVELLQPPIPPDPGSMAMEFWVGVECVPLPSMIRSHLHLEQGLLVKSVAPDSPASRAGVESQDVLLAYASQSVDQVEQLVELIQTHRDEPVSVTLLRHGRELEQTLIAEPRLPVATEERVYTFGAVVGKEFDARTIQTAIDKWMANAPAVNAAPGMLESSSLPRGRLRMVFVRPGVMLSQDELEFGREIQLDDHRQLRIKAVAGDDLRLELQDRDNIVVFRKDELEKAPAGLRETLSNVSRRILWMGGPFEVAGEPLEFFPPGPLTLGWSPRVDVSSTWNVAPLQIVVESDLEPVSSNISTFQLQAIQVVERERDQTGEINVSVEMEQLDDAKLEQRQRDLEHSLESLEQQIEDVRREIEALERINQGRDSRERVQRLRRKRD